MNLRLPLSHGQSVCSRGSWWALLILVGGIALGFRLYYVTHVVMFQPANQPGAKANAVQYYNYARNLVQHGVYSADPVGTSHPVGDSFRDPGYPLFLAAWMEVFPNWDSWYAAVILSQAALGAATVLLWLGVGRRWMPMGWLAAAGVLMAIWPHSVAMCSHLLSETLYGFLVALALFVFSIGADRPTFRWSLIAGICFSVAALTNSVSLPFAALLVVYMLIKRHMPAKIGLCLIAATLSLTVPWMIRNSMQPADQPSSTDRALMNLIQGSWPIYHSAYMASMLSGNSQAMSVMAQINRETAVIETDHQAGVLMMLERMARHPGQYLYWYLQKPALLWDWSIRVGVGDIYVYVTYHSPFETNTFWRAVEATCYALNRMLMVLAFAACLPALLRKQQQQGLAGAALLALFVTIIHSVLQAEPRYSIPYRGLEIILAAFTCHLIATLVLDLRSRANRSKINKTVDSRSRLSSSLQTIEQENDVDHQRKHPHTPLGHALCA